MKYVLLVHLAATLVMVGVIWFVQIVHYPLFSRVGSGGFALYSDAHSRLTTYVVGPPMLIEAATALFLVFRRPEDIPLLAAALVGLALVGVVWLSTTLLQVPRHSTLGSGFDHAAWSGLVLTNWVRTGENFDDDVNRVVPFEYSAKLATALKLHGIDDPHTALTVFLARAEALSDLREQL